MAHVSIKPEMLRWAIDRSGKSAEKLAQNSTLKKLNEWLAGTKKPTLKQLQAFARSTYTPFGYLLLPKPPEEKISIPDFRTLKDRQVERPSPDLIDTIHLMQRRQDWMREFVIDHGQERLSFVGSAGSSRSVYNLASSIRGELGLKLNWAQEFSNHIEALKHFRERVEEVGIMVNMSGIVGNNSHRSLDVNEFRGFVLCDEYAPLIFVNSNDSKSAQMFTLAHELVHVWLGKDGLFNLIDGMPEDNQSEQFCNQVAAELLIPAELVKESWNPNLDANRALRELASFFKVSPIATARRCLDLQMISKNTFFGFYKEIQDEWEAKKNEQSKSGGNYYDTAGVRLGKRFSIAIAIASREGSVLLRDAYKLTGMKSDSFQKYTSDIMEAL